MGKLKVKSESEIIIGEYPFHKKLKDEVVSLLENYPDQQGRKSNVKATMTEWEWGEDIERVGRLKRFILEKAQAASDLGPYVPYNLKVDEFWANIYRKGDFTLPHDHIGRDAFLSFAYFLKTEWYHTPFVFTWSGKKLKPKEGTFIIFPSHLKHHVPENKYEETRITLSGNLRLKEEK